MVASKDNHTHTSQGNREEVDGRRERKKEGKQNHKFECIRGKTAYIRQHIKRTHNQTKSKASFHKF
jgi:hypothetical protein